MNTLDVLQAINQAAPDGSQITAHLSPDDNAVVSGDRMIVTSVDSDGYAVLTIYILEGDDNAPPTWTVFETGNVVYRVADLAAFGAMVEDAALALNADAPIEGVEEIDPTDLPVMQREANKTLMVAFINAQLLDRANLDVRRSIVFYDFARDFVYATNEMPSAPALRRLRAATPIRYWSKGC